MIAVALVAGVVGFMIGNGSPADRKLASVAENLGGEKENAAMIKVEGEGAEKEGGAMLASENAITVKNQKAGNNVTIEALSLTGEGWVAIHDTDQNGWILGARKFAAGKQTALTVPLKRVTEAGKTYAAMIHRSNGDEKFEFRAGEPDGPLMSSEGKPISIEFRALTAEN